MLLLLLLPREPEVGTSEAAQVKRLRKAPGLLRLGQQAE